MKSLNGKELMRGDCVLTELSGVVIAGNVHELYDRTQQVRIAGFAIPVKAVNCVLASDAWATVMEKQSALKAQAEQAAAVKAAVAAAQKNNASDVGQSNV